MWTNAPIGAGIIAGAKPSARPTLASPQHHRRDRLMTYEHVAPRVLARGEIAPEEGAHGCEERRFHMHDKLRRLLPPASSTSFAWSARTYERLRRVIDE